MSNMKYCRFQNTLSDLEDCLYSMEMEEELSADEQKAKEELISLCSEIHFSFGEEEN